MAGIGLLSVDFQGWHVWENAAGRVIANGPEEHTRLMEFATRAGAVHWFYITGRDQLARAIEQAQRGADV